MQDEELFKQLKQHSKDVSTAFARTQKVIDAVEKIEGLERDEVAVLALLATAVTLTKAGAGMPKHAFLNVVDKFWDAIEIIDEASPIAKSEMRH